MHSSAGGMQAGRLLVLCQGVGTNEASGVRVEAGDRVSCFLC